MNRPTLNGIAPIFQVTDVPRAIEFYTQVLDFEVEWTSGTPTTHASVCRNSVEINLEQLNAGEATHSSHAYVQVSGVDEYYRMICAAGVSVKVPLADRFYGMRDCRVLDLDGNELSLGEELPEAFGV
jgi:uncharacterized glyoxalase superfamily protein PhnB